VVDVGSVQLCWIGHRLRAECDIAGSAHHAELTYHRLTQDTSAPMGDVW
jgi:hypothetical protein